MFSLLADCETGSRTRDGGVIPGTKRNIVSDTGKYYGYFQFSLATWRGVGMQGVPTDYDYDTQLAAAKRLQARSGWGQWPDCRRRLGYP